VWSSPDGETWTLSEAQGGPAIWCDPTQELGHWEARNDLGRISIGPYGEGDAVEFVPNEE
jgi:hypothetical protein